MIKFSGWVSPCLCSASPLRERSGSSSPLCNQKNGKSNAELGFYSHTDLHTLRRRCPHVDRDRERVKTLSQRKCRSHAANTCQNQPKPAVPLACSSPMAGMARSAASRCQSPSPTGAASPRLPHLWLVLQELHQSASPDTVAQPG